MKPASFKPLNEEERKLVTLILQSSMTRDKLAKASGVNRFTIGRFVNGIRISKELQDKIKAVL